MTADNTLWDLEERFWTQGADSARSSYSGRVESLYCLILRHSSGRCALEEKDVAQRWRSIVMSERYLSSQDDIAVLAYRVSAERSGEPIYEALCTSTYLKDDDNWVRLSHKQTSVI